MKKLILLFLPLLFTTFQLVAQGQNDGFCAAPEYRQFDFWIGEWDVFANGKLVGTNKIEPILGGCTLMENWVGKGRSRGHSFNTYNQATEKWEQTWVDNSGSVIHFYGTYADNKMSFTGEDFDAIGELDDQFMGEEEGDDEEGKKPSCVRDMV